MRKSDKLNQLLFSCVPYKLVLCTRPSMLKIQISTCSTVKIPEPPGLLLNLSLTVTRINVMDLTGNFAKCFDEFECHSSHRIPLQVNPTLIWLEACISKSKHVYVFYNTFASNFLSLENTLCYIVPLLQIKYTQ